MTVKHNLLMFVVQLSKESQTAVTAHFSSEPLPPFGLVAVHVPVTHVRWVKYTIEKTLFIEHSQANTRRSPNSVLMLGRRRRRRANIKTTLGKRLVFAGRRWIITLTTLKYFLYKPWRTKGFSCQLEIIKNVLVLSRNIYIPWFFPLFLNIYVMGLRPLYVVWLFSF